MAAAKRVTRDTAPRTSAYEVSWRRLHPSRAAEERIFRKDRADRERAHAKRDKVSSPDVTPEMAQKAARRHAGSLARLYTAGHLTIDQLAASQEIAQAAARIGADVRIGTFSLETRVDQSLSGTGAFYEALGAVRSEVAYSRWRQLPGAAVLVSMICEDLPISGAAKLFQCRAARARAIVSELLDAWQDAIGTACKEIDAAELAAAQAGLF